MESGFPPALPPLTERSRTMPIPAESLDLPLETAAPSGAAGLDNAANHKNMLQLIELRWIAVIGQIATIFAARFIFGFDLPVDAMFAVLGALVAFNIASKLRWRSRRKVTDGELFLALLVDVSALTAQLYLSGGATNPFIFLFLLQVILGALLLKPGTTWLMVLITSVCFAALALVSRPLSQPLNHDSGLLFSPYIQGMLICFGLNAALLVIFIKRIGRNLRARDKRLAQLRQRAAEEEHIVRMGLLASGAAHELGTPLSTLSVILGDWRHMPAFANDPELRQEIDEMLAQVQRCKSTVSGILLAAGETRGESSAKTTLATFLEDLVADWRATRLVEIGTFTFVNRFGQDLPMVSDSTLKQMICNVLDNALEASPRCVALTTSREGDTLVLTVTDTGPGFTANMLARFGKPYHSSKERPGSGVGLFLSVNVARTLGGSISARNRPEGGAEVTLRLPLAPLTLAAQEVSHGL